jgi:hypothetical protein
MRIYKQELVNWEKFVKELERNTPVELNENTTQKLERKSLLEADWQQWLKYYFPQYCAKPFTKWQKKYASALLKSGKNFITRKVFRGGAKTTFTQMFVVYLIMTKRKRNILWVSKNQDAAIEMIRVLRLQFEGNQRLINDYGDQKNIGAWGDEKFVTRNGASVRAIGKGQSPRGAKEEESRPDAIICDDCDDDEEVRNKTRLDNTYDWVMGALFGCFSVNGDNLFVGLGNKIAKDCLIERLSAIADDTETINLLNAKGQPTCPEWFTLADCLYMMNKMGTRLAQQEYQNNPITEGKVFKTEWLQDKEMPSLKGYTVLLSYLDPSFKSKKNNDHKALVLIGLKAGEIHIIKTWCNVATVNEMVLWHYELDQYCKQRNAVCEMWMEEVFLQDLLYEDFNEAAVVKGYPVPIRGDTRKKPDKDARISAMSGYFERGQIYFNALESDNHHMIRLKEQFQLFESGSNGVKKDGPDSVEGAIYKAKEKIFINQPAVVGTRTRSKNTY